jgi:pimeloyl-ACP methyl ester carboxylesterase
VKFEDCDCGRVSGNGADLFYRRHGRGQPVVLVHGCPQHSLMWHAIGPLMAEHFDVIAFDQRGMGMSSIASSGFDGTTKALDLLALVEALGIERARIVGYDLGAQTAASFARDFPERVVRTAFLEYALPGFGYEEHMVPQPDWTIDSNWHLALFTVPAAAEFLIRGRERQMLSWWFHHIAYSGDQFMSPGHFEAYARSLSKPGALRACIEHYASVWKDARDNAVIRDRPLTMPTLAMGGESSLGPVLEHTWRTVACVLTCTVVPKAGHWLSDENPRFTAEALCDFFRG